MGVTKESNQQRDHRIYHKIHVFKKTGLRGNHYHDVHWRTEVVFMKEGVKQCVNSKKRSG